MDDNTLLQLEGYVESVVYRNEENGYTVVEISDDDDYITAVGIMPRVHQGDLLKLTGNYKEHPNYGRQFSAQVCELCRPSGTAGILRYLSSGAIRGIGATTAQRLVSEFGEKTLDVMENEPERVAMLKGISKSKAEDFSLGSFKTPKVEREEDDDPDAAFLEKMYSMELCLGLFDACYKQFLDIRLSSLWDKEVQDISAWMSQQA